MIGSQERLGLSFHGNSAILQDVGPFTDLQGELDILFHQKDRYAPAVNMGYGFEGFLHEHRLEAQRGLIQKEKTGLRHEGPSNGQHLPLSAG